MMLEFEFTYYAWAVLLLLGSATAWATNFVMLPGNWIVVGLAALFAWQLPAEAEQGLRWQTVGLVAALAAFGEVLELAAGAAGAARRGASRRAVVLAVVGAISGSFFGAFAGLPIPIVGPLVGALGGAAGGAFAGAYIGEAWKGRTIEARLDVGRGAMIGRLLGTAGKLAVGAVMLGVIAVNVFT